MLQRTGDPQTSFFYFKYMRTPCSSVSVLRQVLGREKLEMSRQQVSNPGLFVQFWIKTLCSEPELWLLFWV